MTKEEYLDNKSWGIHTGLDLHNCNPETIRDADKIKQYVVELCQLIGVTRYGECQVVHFADHNEDVAGFSMVQLIETSLISAHFANKTNHTYLDIFSCAYYDPDVVKDFSQKFFEAKDCVAHIQLRK
jgi:S-adenosylmethionine/arginine decarboxylase-like enzyme